MNSFVWKKFQSGQTLVEVLVALTAAVVVVAAIVTASLNALNNSDYARDQNIASQYTQAGIETIRDMRNESIASLSATYLPDGTYCLAKDCTALDKSNKSCWTKGSICGQNVDKFVREAVVVHNSSDCNASPTPSGQQNYLPSNVKVTINTYWNDSRCTDSSNQFCHYVTLSSCFSDFTILPAP